MDNDAISTMTPEQATAALAAMGTAAAPSPPAPTGAATQIIPPATAADARQQLDRLSADRGWGKRVIDGDADARRQFAELTAAVAAGDDVADAIAGKEAPAQILETTVGGELPRRHLADLVADMRRDGISDGAIAEAIEGSPVTRAVAEAARQFQRMKHTDPDWCDRLLRGEYSAVREHKLMCIILSSPIA